ncbi:type 1 glutamine amidotransferase domain-containing protein [Ligilactobacillus saerimneri]|uniref:Type 1 glutamine amidotransferase domain-containing protein n=1 Tax=Ligilactobacillus saerimneri TaxID=228229 RepID=A0A7H9EKL7_9LACO|nr:type 1 glutamine amidotransferase domain-containing protein [Ligilactobacillus saerimneri]QLL77929.1 type 1 glutamine amidotransferase domain-containing protein [Ligilactobacillus saerimneri]
MKKILVVETNQATYGRRSEATGLWLGETTEFVLAVQAAGYQVDYASPKGGYVPLDPQSMKYADQASMELYQQPSFQQMALAHTLAPVDVDPAAYVAIYYAGGHGVMWDFLANQGLRQIAEDIYRHGGYISSVCHGIAGLLNLHRPDGENLLRGKQVTGFTTGEEILAGKRRIVPFLNQEAVKIRGGHFVKKRPYTSFALRDGRLITGQNPFSARAVAQELLTALASAQ